MNRDESNALPPTERHTTAWRALRSLFTRDDMHELRVTCADGHAPETVAVIDTRGRLAMGTHWGQVLDPDHRDVSDDLEALEAVGGVRRRFRLACPVCGDDGHAVATFTADRLPTLARYRRLAGPVVDLSVLARYISG